MITNEFLQEVDNKINNLELRSNYQGKAFARNFNSHLDTLVETSIQISAERSSIFESKEIQFTKSLYWQTENHILETLNINSSNEINNQIDELEEKLYDSIIEHLGQFYDRSTTQKLMIDETVNNVLMYVRFNQSEYGQVLKNPWEDAKNILFDNQIVYTFTDNVNELMEYGFKLNPKESEITKYNRIGLLGKGYKKGYASTYIRDLISLRNTLVLVLQEDGYNSRKPIKFGAIVSKLRNIAEISPRELSDNNIKTWLINPLKHTNRLGSNKDGYFVIEDCIDLEASYKSHFENFKGYYRTLEKHKQSANKFGCIQNYDKHNQFLIDEIINRT